jgi:hypothetical protein
MKFNHFSITLSGCITVSILFFIMSACHLQSRPSDATDTSITARNSVDSSGSGNHKLSAIPQTGQKRQYMAGDDGDLRVGNAWPVPRFTENGDDTVTDHFSGLMWTINANKANGKVDWEQAISGAGTCNDGRYTDWRLPNRNELESLIDLGRYDPALPTGHPFNSVQPTYYWTSTTPANNEDHAWIIHFYIGFVTHDDKGGTHYVWYVRGGQ